jgi:hypothetical protein
LRPPPYAGGSEPEQQAGLFAECGYLPVRLSAYGLEASRQVLGKYPYDYVPMDAFVEMRWTPAKLGPRSGCMPQVWDAVTDALERAVGLRRQSGE